MADDKGQETTVSLVVDDQLLSAVDKRASKLDLNRSQYFRRLAREDIERAKQQQQKQPQQKAA